MNLHNLNSELASSHAPQGAWLRLRFPTELEREFLTSYRASARRWIRVSLLVALSTTLGFAVIDHWVLPGKRTAMADLVRFGLQLPVVALAIILTSPRFYGRWYQPVVQVGAPLFGIGLVLMAVQSSNEHMLLVSARLLLATFFIFFMLGMTFSAALRTNLIVFAGFATACALGAVPSYVAVYQLFVLFCANLIGGAGCYALEHANRVAFLERRRLAQVAMHDGLTGLLNRSALEEQVRRLWQYAQRERLPVSVVLIDIDHFKAFNDCYGHQQGDRCLREVASAVRSAVRRHPLDLVARYGGEELIAFLFGADRARAETVARDIREAVAALRIPHIASPIQPYVTVSVGAATVEPDSGGSHDLAIRLADRALYEAKARGRDGWAFCDRSLAASESDHHTDVLLRTGS